MSAGQASKLNSGISTSSSIPTSAVALHPDCNSAASRYFQAPVVQDAKTLTPEAKPKQTGALDYRTIESIAPIGALKSEYRLSPKDMKNIEKQFALFIKGKITYKEALLESMALPSLFSSENRTPARDLAAHNYFKTLFKGIKLSDIKKIKEVHFTFTHLIFADLSGVDLTKLDLTGACLHGIKVKGDLNFARMNIGTITQIYLYKDSVKGLAAETKNVIIY